MSASVRGGPVIGAPAVSRATGLSKRYVWLIRRGEYVPHPMHWEALRHLAGSLGEREGAT